MNRQTDKQIERWADREKDKHSDIQVDKHTGRQIYRQTDKRDGQTEEETDRKTDRDTVMLSQILNLCISFIGSDMASWVHCKLLSLLSYFLQLYYIYNVYRCFHYIFHNCLNISLINFPLVAIFPFVFPLLTIFHFNISYSQTVLQIILLAMPAPLSFSPFILPSRHLFDSAFLQPFSLPRDHFYIPFQSVEISCISL